MILPSPCTRAACNQPHSKVGLGGELSNPALCVTTAWRSQVCVTESWDLGALPVIMAQARDSQFFFVWIQEEKVLCIMKFYVNTLNSSKAPLSANSLTANADTLVCSKLHNVCLDPR